MKTRIGIGKSIGALLVCAGMSSIALASWDFVPTPFEWQSWPEYCRVQFSSVTQGLEDEYAGWAYSASEIASWRQLMGEHTFDGLHHFCASIHFLNRARGQSDPKMRSFMLQRAFDDAIFSFTRADHASLVYPNMVVNMAQIFEASGKRGEAISVLQRGLSAQPDRPEPYMMLALLEREEHKLAEGRDVLKQADRATGGKSAEIQYNLGLMNLELGDVDAAHANARTAYSLGYPLPGLKNKLRKLGHWGEADDDLVASAQAEQARNPSGPKATAPSTVSN